MKPAARLVGLAVLTAVMPSCTCKGEEKHDLAPAKSATPTLGAPTPMAARANGSVSIDPLDMPESCAFGHDGPLLDLGEPAMQGRVEPSDPARTERFEREGATWLRFHDATASMTFVAPADDVAATEGTLVQARARGIGARSVVAYLNGKPVGTMTLTKGSDALAFAHAPPGPSLLVPGVNELTLRFRGNATRARSVEPMAEVDWIHVGSGDPDPSYAAPTRLDVRTNATIGGVAKQSLSMLAPSFVRCTGWLPEAGHVEISAGLSSPGEADVEVRILRDRAAPNVLKTIHVNGSSAWVNESLSLGDVGQGGTLGALEVAVVRGPKSGRVLLGQPRVVGSEPKTFSLPPPSRGVVVVVMGELSPRAISLYGGKTSLPELANLARDGVVFDAHRASATTSNAALAAMLTGRAPRITRGDGALAQLPVGAVTLGDMARQAGVVAAFFTANPTTGKAFGFARSWETFVEHPPNEEGGAVRIFDDAATWLDAHEGDRFLVVLDARGGHPPWDVTPDELKTMPPEDYGGGLDPKHAAELLAKARRVPPLIRFTDADRARAAALYEKAILAHDAGLGRVMNALRAAGRDKDTTVIVTSDIGVNDAAHVPYGDGDPPDEALLAIPLVLRDASHAGAGTRVALPTCDLDVAPTAMGALGLTPSSLFSGIDLRATAAGVASPSGRVRIASSETGRYAVRWGSFVLHGRVGQRAELCDLSLEASCVADVRTTHPLALDAIARRYDDVQRAPIPDGAPEAAPPVPVVLDAAAQAALKAWGRGN